MVVCAVVLVSHDNQVQHLTASKLHEESFSYVIVDKHMPPAPSLKLQVCFCFTIPPLTLGASVL